MVHKLNFRTDKGILCHSAGPLFLEFSPHFQAFRSPDSMHSFETHFETFQSQRTRHLPVTEAGAGQHLKLRAARWFRKKLPCNLISLVRSDGICQL
jgi:hypothetical protein